MPSPRTPRTITTAALATVAVGLAAAPAHAAMPSTSGLGSRSGVVVVDLDSGRTLLNRGGDATRIPASVTKLFTVGAALRLLGPDWAPRTRVVATGSLVGDVWQGDLHLVGGGDPTLTSAALKALAGRAVAALGAASLDGRVRIDATAFDDFQGGDRTGRQADGDMGGRLSAVAVDRGARTTDPADRAGSLFRTALRGAGLQLTGAVVKDTTRPAGGTVVAEQFGPTMRQLASATLGPSDNYVAETLLKDIAAPDGVEGACRVAAQLPPVVPDPLVAEPPTATRCSTTAATTPSATTAAGSLLLRRTLRPMIGATPLIRDGSGLTRRNRVSPATVVRLLRSLSEDELLGPLVRTALPQAGRTGTLAGRMRGTAAVGRCAAKTGTIRGVSGLAGYCTTKRGREVAFAILQNGGDVGSARSFQDRFVARLAQSG